MAMRVLVTDGMDAGALAKLREDGFEMVEQFYEPDELGVALREFDAVLGLDNLCAVHLNDSKNHCGSRKDRHEKLGLGCIGADALREAVRHPLLQNRPFILETPNDDAGYAAEIQTVKEWMK